MDRVELRCTHCHALLGVFDALGLTFERGGLHAEVPDAHTASLTCYRCARRNHFKIVVDDHDNDNGGTPRKKRSA